MVKEVVLITRPIEEAQTLADKLQHLGASPLIAPMIDIMPVSGSKSLVEEYYQQAVQELLITSVNSLKVLGYIETSIPLIVVGKATVNYAQAIGYTNVTYAGKNVDAFQEYIQKHCETGKGSLVYASGNIITSNIHEALAEQGYDVKQIIMYQSKACLLYTSDAADES